MDDERYFVWKHKEELQNIIDTGGSDIDTIPIEDVLNLFTEDGEES